MDPLRTTGAALCVVVLALPITACGNDSDSSSKASSGSSSTQSGGGGGYGSSSSSSASSQGSTEGLKVEGTPVSLHGEKTVSGETSVELDDNYFEPTVLR